MLSTHPISLSPSQLQVMDVSARAASALSITASFFVIASFLGSNLFRTPVNRLTFYATWGNLFANIGTMMGSSEVSRGEANRLCHVQAFILQWFLPANSLWIFCMALNVYLTSFRRYRPTELKRLEWRYFILCYLIPFIPAFIFLFIRTRVRGPVYGDAIMWCWIRPEWKALRFAFFYGPVWFVVIITVSILTYAGIEILSRQKKIRRLSATNIPNIPDKCHLGAQRNPTIDVAKVPLVTNATVDGLGGELANAPAFVHLASSGDAGFIREQVAKAGDTSPMTTWLDGETSQRAEDNRSSSINLRRSSTQISSHPLPSLAPCATTDSQMWRESALRPSTTLNLESLRSDFDELENVNTLHSSQIDMENIPRSTISGIYLENIDLWIQSHSQSWHSSHELVQHQVIESQNAAYSYIKRVSLFFLSLFVTWTPSTLNRVHRLSSPHEPVFVLSLLATSVLPLQGFWNLVVYIYTSFDSVKVLYAKLRTRWRMRWGT
ncbi:uncharacterized protein PADG_01410 [Paracoccidioides brasiliensis Pb18]|uniref:G-protein coupled receptors family 2 profile 2 domain-containing protein n=1 Tax=Paracoccidioides brasiliensis (strain Pb18) TaxID=502780 RepID=C1G394_PARBD|nr:uncharacterized protein PADG_01410 [Paracoccidioides brasiliensis Pb18]EEH45260.2 hypothetical protein PADG_01410 [Paracoccidioides brasiliensis Pb18]ODH51271.1 hypothetical protein GX48_02511 [Paracoccidioides brasiliensis]